MSLLETAVISASRNPLEAVIGLTVVSAIRSQSSRRHDAEEEAAERAERRAEESRRRMQRAIDEARRENEQLVENNQRLREHLDQMTNETRQRMQDLDSRLSQNENRLDRAEQQMANMQNEMNQLRQRFADENQAAREAVNMVIAQMDAVEKRTLIDRFVPVDAEHVRDRIARLVTSQNTGAVLAAQAEEAMTQVLQMEKDAIRRQQEHDEMVNKTITRLEAMLVVVNENRTIPHKTEQGDVVDIENDFWSHGEYTKLKENLEAMKQQLENRYDATLTEERIKEIDAEIDKSADALEAMTKTSVERAVLSQARMETVYDIMDVMYEQGWTVKQVNNQDASYMGGEEQAEDWREGAFAVMENNGQEVTIIVNPDEEQKQNNLIVHTTDVNQTEDEYHRQVETIAREIGKSGYQIETPKTGGHQHIPEINDGKKLAGKGGAKAIKERIRK